MLQKKKKKKKIAGVKEKRVYLLLRSRAYTWEPYSKGGSCQLSEPEYDHCEGQQLDCKDFRRIGSNLEES